MTKNRNPRSGGRSRVAPEALLGILAAVVAVPLLGSDLEVQNTNVNEGTYAARVGVGTTCADPTHTTVSDPVLPATFTACSSLTSDADVPTGTTRFTAGDLVKLRSGFSVDSGADFTIEIDRTLYPDAWVQDDTPDGEKVYAARFYNDAAALVLEGSEEFFHFIAYDAGGNPEVRVGVKRNGTERRLFLEAFLDNGSLVTTEGTNELLLPGDGNFHWVEVGWTASTGGDNGSAYICVDQASPPTGCPSLSSLDNDTGAIDFVRWGAVDVPSGSSIGDLDLDDFESRSSLNIGPLP
jgi:hypothetical protein